MMTKFKIRPTVRSDAKGLSDLYRKSFGELLKPHYSPGILEAALPLLSQANDNLIGSGRYYAVHDEAHCIVGAGGWSHETPGSGEVVPGHIHLRHFSVSPDFAGQGIGKAIFKRCRDDAGTIVCVECFSTRAALGFYKSLGFETVCEIDIPMGPDVIFPSVHMVCCPG